MMFTHSHVGRDLWLRVRMRTQEETQLIRSHVWNYALGVWLWVAKGLCMVWSLGLRPPSGLSHEL